jgi:hypothetical protein
MKNDDLSGGKGLENAMGYFKTKKGEAAGFLH